MKKSSIIRTYKDEAKNYTLSNYPAVKLHWKCNELSGTDMIDEVRGLIIRPTTSITFGNPQYTVHPEGTTDDPVYNGPYPTFDASKFILILGIGRCMDSTKGRNTLGQIGGSTVNGPGIALSFDGGMHIVIRDNNANIANNSGVDQLVSGTDYILATIVRPQGSNCEGAAYDTNGNIVYQMLALNSTLGLITPCSFNRPNGIAFYQQIVYQFNTEPTDLLTGMKWHAAMAMSGIKAPYPAWKNKT